MASLKSRRAHSLIAKLVEYDHQLRDTAEVVRRVEGRIDIEHGSVNHKKTQEFLSFVEEKRLLLGDLISKLVPISADSFKEDIARSVGIWAENVDHIVKS